MGRVWYGGVDRLILWVYANKHDIHTCPCTSVGGPGPVSHLPVYMCVLNNCPLSPTIMYGHVMFFGQRANIALCAIYIDISIYMHIHISTHIYIYIDVHSDQSMHEYK